MNPQCKSAAIGTHTLRLLCAASLLFFLFYTAPHRVHHSFEQLASGTHRHADTPKRDPDQPNQSPVASDCVFQTAAGRCTFGGSAALPSLASAFSLQERIFFATASRPHRLLDKSFEIRAPPAV